MFAVIKEAVGNAISKCRAKILFEYGLSEEQLSKEEETMSIIINKLLEKHFPINTETN